jgi:hypothetical protein
MGEKREFDLLRKKNLLWRALIILSLLILIATIWRLYENFSIPNEAKPAVTVTGLQKNDKLGLIEVEINPKLSALKNASVRFVLTLKRIEGARFYNIQVKRLGNKILDKDFFNEIFEFDLMAPGEYFIHLQAYDESKKLIGESRDEKVVVIPFVPLPAPRLRVKELELELDSSFKKILKGLFEIIFPSAYAKNDRVAFEWDNIEGAKSYRLIIASDNEFSNVIESFDIPDNRFEWVKPNVGYFFWKVRAVDQFGYEGDESAVGTMVIRPSFKKISPPHLKGDLKEKDQTYILNLKWNLIQNAKYYVLRFIDNENHETFEKTSDPVLVKELVEDVKVQIKAVSKSGKETVYSNEYQWKVPRKEIPVVASKVELYEDFTYSRSDLSLLHFDYTQIGTSKTDLKAAKFDNIGILAGGDYHLPIHSKPHLFYFFGGNVLMTRVVGDKLSQNLYFTEFCGGLNQKHQNVEWGGGIAFSYVSYLETPETVSSTTLLGLPLYVLFNQSKFQEKIYLKPYISGPGNFLIKFDVTYFFKEKLGTTFYYFQDKYPLPNDVSASSSGLGLGLTWVN